VVNWRRRKEPHRKEGPRREPERLNATESRDPDGNKLTFRWFVTVKPAAMADVRIENAEEPEAIVTPTFAEVGQQVISFWRSGRWDPTLYSYRRVVLTVE